MKILMIVNYYYPYVGGVQEYVKRLSEGLVKKRHSVTVLTCQYNDDFKVKEYIGGVEVIRCRPSLTFMNYRFTPLFLLTALKLSKLYDIVNLHVPMTEVAFFSLCFKNYVVTHHADVGFPKGFVGRIKERIYSFLHYIALKRAKRVVTYTEDYARNSSLLKPHLAKCLFILPPVPNSFRHQNPTEFRKEHNLNNKKIVGFVGRFVRQKGIPYLLDSILDIKKQFRNVKVVLVGDYDTLVREENLGIQSRIEKFKSNLLFIPPIRGKKLQEFFSACDVLVLPSIDKGESFGIVQVEAMYCGTPMVASSIPGVRVPIQMTGMGLLAKAKDSKSLAHCIVKVIRYKKSFIKSRSKLVELFSMDNSLRLYENLYDEVRHL